MDHQSIPQKLRDTETVISSAGENYQYIKTIVNNHIEIKKLELLQSSTRAVGSSILFIIIAILIGVSSILFISLAVVLLAGWLDSWVNAFAFMSILMLLLAVILYLARHILIFKPIESKMIGLILEDD